MEIIQHEEGVEQGNLIVTEGPFQMDPGTLDGRFALPDFADPAHGCHLCLLLKEMFDELVKSLFSPQNTPRSQRKYFHFQQVISAGFVLSVVNFQFLRIQYLICGQWFSRLKRQQN